jgi:hypothetical protein
MSIESIQEEMLLSEPADLFTGRERGRNVGYRHFASLAAAVTYCVEELGPVQLSGAAIEVGDNRIVGKDIRTLYAQPNFPRELTTAP